MIRTCLTLCALAIFLLAACDPTPATPQTVGSITQISSPHAYVGGSQTSDGESLHATDNVSTDPSGNVSFDLDEKGTLCNMSVDSEVQVHPSSSVLINWVRGTTSCSTAGGGSTTVHTVTSNGTSVDWEDPVFQVVVSEKEDTVRVLNGFVQVRSAEVAGQVLLGPDQQTVVSPGQAPTEPEPVTLTEVELQLFEGLEQRYQVPELERPSDIGDSERLARVFEQRMLRVGYDGDQMGGQDLEFMRMMVGLLAETWQVQFELRAVSPEAAAKLIEAGELDLFVSPRAPETLTSQAFFEGADSVPLSLAYPADSEFRVALEGFLRASVEQKQYGNLYQQVYGRTPSYQPLEEIFLRP